ncbi:CAAX amino terminal protease [Syntrophomonas zehnderi OL-4]|uniref:CAAX amino terminal protease n=1 Tax=Syntrophomonas zehnderi OL-4 TaxID=690567 RepID=A0A0E4C8G3_9FIRM|nr:CPBP family intramembrane glutamic endopeptidase [Syntrophomonas zehnderi]CFX42964.1 CAAX amino terminal protease [Syntrophomonas zehnderi OL-4]
MLRKYRYALIFIALTFLINWLLIGMFLALGEGWGSTATPVVLVAYMFVPMLVAILVQKLIKHEKVIKPLQVSFKLNRWFLAAWLLPPLLAIGALGISLLWPGVHYSPELTGMFDIFGQNLSPEQAAQMRAQMEALPISYFWIALIQGLIAGITVNAVAAFGEELGWRGFLLREFRELGFWRASLLIGFIWGLWHAPVILQGHNYPQHPVAGVGMMIIWCMLLTPIFVYIRVKAQSVIAAAIMHGTLNGTAGLAILMIQGGNDLTVGLTGLAGFLVLLLTNILIAWLNPKFDLKPLAYE